MGEHSLQNKTRKRVAPLTSRQKTGLVLVAVTVTLACLFFWYFFRQWNSSHVASPVVDTSSSAAMTVRDPLTGVLVDKAEANKQIYGVMIDEHVDARPQSGLDKAFLVIEAPVEAGFPRLLAFFSADESVPKIGPVRSARPYFIDWVNELDAVYAHVGGSNEALDKIAKGSTIDLNQFWHDPQFWRSTDRSAPPNVSTSTDLLGTFVKSKADAGHPLNPLYGVWKFKTTDEQNVQSSQQIAIHYISPDNNFQWVFDHDSKKYVREENNSPALTQDGQKILADNIAVVVTDVKTIDNVGRQSVRTIGSGTAYVFQDGRMTEAVWRKPSASERLRFFAKDGTEMEMNPGVTWMEVVGDASQMNVSP